MSAFLGPIHYWLYKKIRFQEQITRYIQEQCGREGNISEVIAAMDEQCGRLPDGDLADLIDGTNIHGWLQSQLHIVESRFAYLVTNLLHGGVADEERVREIVRGAGEREQPVAPGSSPAEAYEDVDALLLNGMPCDRINMIAAEDDDSIVWELASDIHGSYWEQAGGRPETYYELREALLEGFLKNTGLAIETNDMTYTIRRSGSEE